jgi:hypothetical protein
MSQGRWLNRHPDVGTGRRAFSKDENPGGWGDVRKLPNVVARWGVAANNVLRGLRENSACRAAGHSACDLSGALPNNLMMGK